MHRATAMLTAGTLATALLTPTGALAQPPTEEWTGARATAPPRVLGKPTTPTAPAGVNPFLALLPEPDKADHVGWRNWLAAKGGERAARKAEQQALAPAPLLVDEDEPIGLRDANNSPTTAQPIDGFGTDAAQSARLRVLGTLSPEPMQVVSRQPNPEDDGSIPLAGETGIGTRWSGIRTWAEIGDGPHGDPGTGRGDFDFYKLDGVAGEVLTIDIDTQAGTLDSVVILFDGAGTVVGYNDDTNDEINQGRDSLLVHTFTADGTYYAMVGDAWTSLGDPFDSGSGSGISYQAPYAVAIYKQEQDVDFFSVWLRAGDVLGVSVDGAADWATIYDTERREVKGSTQDLTYEFPAYTPLPGGGKAVTDHVAEQAGWHYVGVSSGDGDYDITVEAYRPGLEGQQPPQTLFLDFDGARLNMTIFRGHGVRTLSPLRAFLARWGLTNADEDALIDAIVAGVEENLRQDLIDSGLNERFDLRILNSRDHADPFGQPNVSRVIVGGTVAESWLGAISIAQSIDPGNFDTEESALVLQDQLSDPAGNEASLNSYLTDASDRIGFVGQALGNLAAHEAGHLFGNAHVDSSNERPNVMDRGNNFLALFGVGPDGVGGTDDDLDVDFGEDVHSRDEGFTGIQDTLSRPAFAVTG